MSRGTRWLIAGAIVAAALAALAVVILGGERSLVVIENRSGASLTLSVETTNASRFAWQGELGPGERVMRIARFSDNSFVVVCRDEAGIHRTRGGYVTNGMPQRIDIVANGCSSVTIDVTTFP
jgi:hypothetical protein